MDDSEAADDVIGQIVKDAEILAEGKVFLRYTLRRNVAADGKSLYSLSIREVYNGVAESVVLDDLTDSQEEAERLFSLFYEGTVTVCTAEDVLTEILYTL